MKGNYLIASSLFLYVPSQGNNTSNANNIPFNYLFTQQIFIRVWLHASTALGTSLFAVWSKWEIHQTRAFKKTVGRKNTPWYGNEDVGFPLEKLGPGLSWSSSPRPPSQLTAVSRAAALHMSSPTPLVPLQTGLGQFSQSWNHCSPVLWYPREHMHCEPLKYPQHRWMRPAVWGMKNDQQMRPSCILQNEFPFWSWEVSGFK